MIPDSMRSLTDISEAILPTATTTHRDIDMRTTLQLIGTGHAEMKAHIKSFLRPRLPGNLLHIIKAMLVKPTTFHLIKPTHNSPQDMIITSRSTTTKTEHQEILGIPAKPHTLGIPANPHITTTATTPNRRLNKVITSHMGMATAILSILRPLEDGLPRFHQKNGCVLGFRDMRASSNVLHTRTLAFSMTNNSNITTTPSSNLILDLG
jgi:hypothetical protein